MKKFKKCTAMFLTALAISTVSAPLTFASDASVSVIKVDASSAMAQLRMEDQGPDFSKGILIDECWGVEGDGTPYVERTYIKNNLSILSSLSHGTRTFTKTKKYGSTGSVEVTGKFEYDSAEKTVYVLEESGSYNQGGGISDLEDLGTSTSGEGSAKATVTYRCRVNRNLGGWATYSVSVSCNSSGRKS